MASSKRCGNGISESRGDSLAAREFFDGFDIDALIPAEYATYRRPIFDALVHFLSGLPASRLATLMNLLGSSTSGSSSTYAKCIALASVCPTMQKLAQLLARDRRLPAGFRVMLQTLESVTPATSGHEMKARIERELGRLTDLNIELANKPMAEGSVAAVIPFKSLDANSSQRREGVFKVLKPDVERYLTEELALLESVGAHFDDNCQEYGIPSIDYEDTFRRVRELLTCEVRIDLERENLVQARSAYRSNARVLIPELFPLGSDRMIAMERISGDKVTEYRRASPGDRKRWAEWIIEALIADPMWSNGRFFHADPHAGNLLLTSDGGRLGIVDWSLVGRLSKADQLALSRLALGSLTLNAGDVARAISSLSTNRVDVTSLRPVIEDAFRRLRGGELPGLRWTTRLMDDAVQRTSAQFSSDMLLFRRVYYILEGVVADVDPDCDMDQILIGSFLRRLIAESPERFLSPPFCHSFATHISNAEMMQLAMSAPVTAFRYWSGWMDDWLSSGV